MTRSNHGIQKLKTPSTLQIEVSAKLPQFATQSFDMAAVPTYPNNNIQQTKKNPFNGNMKHRTGVILIHILLCVQSSQHQQNTNHQTGYCPDILQLFILLSKSKKIYKLLPEHKLYFTFNSSIKAVSFYRRVLIPHLLEATLKT